MDLHKFMREMPTRRRQSQRDRDDDPRPSRFSMKEYELLRVIDFIEMTRRLYLQHVEAAESDPTWNILLMLVRRTASDQLVTISSLVRGAGIPYATALRRVHKLIDDGWIVKVSRTASGKTSALLPSDRLMQQFEAHAREVKVLLAHTVGWSPSA